MLQRRLESLAMECFAGVIIWVNRDEVELLRPAIVRDRFLLGIEADAVCGLELCTDPDIADRLRRMLVPPTTVSCSRNGYEAERLCTGIGRHFIRHQVAGTLKVQSSACVISPLAIDAPPEELCPEGLHDLVVLPGYRETLLQVELYIFQISTQPGQRDAPNPFRNYGPDGLKDRCPIAGYKITKKPTSYEYSGEIGLWKIIFPLTHTINQWQRRLTAAFGTKTYCQIHLRTCRIIVSPQDPPGILHDRHKYIMSFPHLTTHDQNKSDVDGGHDRQLLISELPRNRKNSLVVGRGAPSLPQERVEPSRIEVSVRPAEPISPGSMAPSSARDCKRS